MDADDDYLADEGEDYLEEDQPRKKQKSHQKRPARESFVSLNSNARVRPTNNQLLYKAHFRWSGHDKLKIEDTSSLITETQECASVTSCFLEVLATLHQAEQMRTHGTVRNVLRELSDLTRKTKVVELSSGTHRVAEELKKHCLHDGVGGQYSTNLDRNRYGNDDNYLFTVIRFNLEFLGLCPCLIDVEIIDAKAEAAGRSSQMVVDAGQHSCTCKGGTVKTVGKPNSAADAAFPSHKRVAGGRQSKASASALPMYNQVKSPSFAMGGMILPPASPNASGSSLDALVLAALPGMGGMGSMGGIGAMLGQTPPDEGLVSSGLLSGLMRNDPIMAAAPNVMSLSQVAAPSLSGGLGISGLLTGGYTGTSAFTRPTPLNQKGTFGFSPLEDQAGSSGGAAGLIILGAANGSNNGPTNGEGKDQQNQAKGNASKLRRALSTGMFESLETGLELFRKSEMDDIASFPQVSSNGGLNSLLGTLQSSLLPANSGGSQRLFKPIKREVSASLLLCADSGGAGNAFGVPSVENSGDNDMGGVNQGAGAGAVSKRTKSGENDKDKLNEGPEDDTVGENEEGETEEDSSQRRKRHVAKQNSVANLSNRVSSAEMKRLMAEIEALRADNANLLSRCVSAEQREQTLREQVGFLSGMMNQSNMAVSQIIMAQLQQQAASAKTEPSPVENGHEGGMVEGDATAQAEDKA